MKGRGESCRCDRLIDGWGEKVVQKQSAQSCTLRKMWCSNHSPLGERSNIHPSTATWAGKVREQMAGRVVLRPRSRFQTRLHKNSLCSLKASGCHRKDTKYSSICFPAGCQVLPTRYLCSIESVAFWLNEQYSVRHKTTEIQFACVHNTSSTPKRRLCFYSCN